MLIALLIVLMIAIDQAVKYWALNILSAVDTMPLIEGVFHLTYVENRGAAFSILQNQRWFFLLITPIILIGIFYVLKKELICTRVGRCAMYPIAAGAVGNLIDRAFRGFVVDLFDFCLIHFPVFNVADIYIVCGVALFFYYILFQADKEQKHG